MDLSSDINLTHPLWERADNELCNNNELGVFNRLVDVYVLACAIGIKEDKTLTDFEVSSSDKKQIGRNTHRENDDIRSILDFMLQNAILLSETLDYDTEERLKLAFNPDYTVKKFSPVVFLTGFANYGIVKIFEHIDSRSSLVVVDELYRYFDSLTETSYDVILESITLEDIIDNE